MLEILEGLSGKTHRLEKDSQTISTDMYKVINRTDGKLSTNKSVKEVPVISKNDMLQVPKGNIMVFGKGNPIWNRNQLAMPYSFQSVHKNALKDFDNPQDYNLRTVPTTANTMDFDILNNQPNFIKMVTKRVEQAKFTKKKIQLYRNNHRVHGHTLTDDDMSRIDPEALSQELMRSVNEQIAFKNDVAAMEDNPSGGFDESNVKSSDELANDAEKNAYDNQELLDAEKEQDAKSKAINKKLYAHGQISKHELLHDVRDDTREALGQAYVELIADFRADPDFEVDNDGNLLIGRQVAIKGTKALLDQTKEQFGENDVTDKMEDSLDSLLDGGSSDADDELNDANKVEIQDLWLSYLANLPNWDGILGGKYDDLVAKIWQSQEDTSDQY